MGTKIDTQYTDNEKSSNVEFNEDFLAKLTDNSVGHYCLKLFTIFINSFTQHLKSTSNVSSNILNCSSQITQTDRQLFILLLAQNQCDLPRLLLDYKTDLSSANQDPKLTKLITYLLDRIFTLDQQTFRFIGLALGLVSPEDQAAGGDTAGDGDAEGDKSRA